MVAEVIVDISNSEIDKIYDYSIPENIGIVQGDRVEVSFGRQLVEGFVIGLKESSDFSNQLKSINKKLDNFTAVSAEMLALMRYMRERYNLRAADVLRLFIPSQLRGGNIKELIKGYATIAPSVDGNSLLATLKHTAVAQRGIIAELINSGGEWVAALNRDYGNQAVKALADKGYIKISDRKIERTPYKNIELEQNTVTLNQEQLAAVESIMDGEWSRSIIHGVTGSGKTEIYMKCIEQVIASGKGAIMLVPEISLTPQMMSRFRARFADNVALLHSGLSAGERFDEWLRLMRGEARIAVGARSAIFAPIDNLGIIIVDEEHDTSYVSESNPRYFTSEIAEFRRAYNGARLVLGSATPSLETYKEAMDGKLKLIKLLHRVENRVMPEMEIVDMCLELREGNASILSKRLVSAIADTLSRGEQAMIFLNRRGYSSFMICRQCGKVLKCDDCEVSLTLHKEDNRLKCHYCGKQYTVPSRCPDCESESIRYGRDGTEKIVSELKKLFPSARLLRMDNDTTRHKSGYLDILSSFARGEADIMVGTQMIAKGHDFASVTLVGILDADMSLYYGDYHSVERTFQLVTQVAGRAGRDKLKGRVILQTYSPKHYVFHFASKYDYEGFYRKEINIREVTEFPPFIKIVRVLVTSIEESDAVKCTKEILIKMKGLERDYTGEFRYLKATKSPITRIENRYRYQVIAKLKRENEGKIIQKIYKTAEEARKGDVSIFVEINPQNLN